MLRSPLEVADVFRDGEARFRTEYGHTLSREQRQVLRAVIRCRTAELGGHVQKCDDCGHQRIQYNSCRNRHCPRCQAMARAAWLEKRESELLPVGYFHAATRTGTAGTAEQTCGLRHPVSCGGADAVGDCRRSAAPGSKDRLSDGSSHLGGKPDASPARSLPSVSTLHDTGHAASTHEKLISASRHAPAAR